MRKKGQLGKIITALPVIIIIVIIMALFIVLSGLLKLAQGPEALGVPSGESQGLALPLQIITFQGRQMTVLEGLLLLKTLFAQPSSNKLGSYESFVKSLQEMDKGSGISRQRCLYLHLTSLALKLDASSPEYSLFLVGDDKLQVMSISPHIYINPHTKNPVDADFKKRIVSVEGKQETLEYYYDACTKAGVSP
ncbi:hypothetical protein KW805_02665 [Candidatus Pacearchaeota archaeon]|nr:hypothetical protein [Candidatus Pacearchaeota archaeon]